MLAGARSLLAQPASGATSPAALGQTAHVQADFGRFPLSFEATEDNSIFVARGSGYSVQLGPDGARLRLGTDDAVAMQLEGANTITPAAADLLPGKVNYILGNDPKRWRTNIPTYAKVTYSNVYPGVDLVYYGNHQALEYDLTLAPRASVKSIRLRFAGAKIGLEANGDLKIAGQHGAIAFHQPVAYQMQGAIRQPVRARFVKISDTEIAFAVGRYDRNLPLVIDPQIVYSTYFSGATPVAIAVDSAGSAYITGGTYGGLPVTAGAFETTSPKPPAPPNSTAHPNVFITKLSPDGQSLVYSTYLGGTYGDRGNAIAVDAAGDAYVTGWAISTDFPVTAGAFQTTNREPDAFAPAAFVTKLDPSGSRLVYSTYLGGSVESPGAYNFVAGDVAYGIAVDATGDAYVTGAAYSFDFPLTAGAYQTTNKAAANHASNVYVAKLNADGTALVYATYIGGSGVPTEGYTTGPPVFIPATATSNAGWQMNVTTLQGDIPAGIALDGAGNAYVAGTSASLDYPTTPGALQTTNRTMADPSRLGPGYQGFVTKLNPTGTALVYSTYLGGSGSLWYALAPDESSFYVEFSDTLTAIAVDPAGNAYVAGQSGSTDYPVTPGAIQATNPQAGGPAAGQSTGFYSSVFSEFDPTGGLTYSTYFDGSTAQINETDGAKGIAIDGSGSVYIDGTTSASDFPVTINAVQAKYAAGQYKLRDGLAAGVNAYLTVFHPAASQLVFSTYLGGSTIDTAIGLAYGAQDNAYLVGTTASSDFPITPHAFETTPGGDFITKINIDPPGKVFTRSVLTVGQPAYGQLSLLATVYPLTITLQEPTLTGAVTFLGNGTALGPPVPLGNSAPTASMTTSITGPLTLGCTYSGDTYYASSICTVNPDFAILLANPTVTVSTGDQITTTATLISLGFAGSITTVCDSVPAHLACQTSPLSNVLTVNGTSAVSIHLDTEIARNTTLGRLSDRSPAQFAFLLLPCSLLAGLRLRLRGQRYAASMCCALALTLATVALSGCGELIVPYKLPAGTYTVSIVARSGGFTPHTAQLTVIVTP
jgi:hypothetical protein